MDLVRSRLEAYCRDAFGQSDFVVESIEPVPTGHSGFTYFVEASAEGEPRRFVLRLPPPGARIAGPADVARQGRIMRALGDLGLPVPPVPIICEDPEALDGRPFILLDRVGGGPVADAVAEQGSIEVARSTVESLRDLHAVPLDLTGIGEETPMALGGEVERWATLMARGVADLTDRSEDLVQVLKERMPPEQPPRLVHGDYHYGNLLFTGARVSAILDWEIAQIGQPLMDLATLCVIADRRRIPTDPNPGGAVAVTSDELMQMYGADSAEMTWYFALGCFKYAAIYAYNLMLHRRGKRVDPHYERLTGTIPGLIDRGLEVLGG